MTATIYLKYIIRKKGRVLLLMAFIFSKNEMTTSEFCFKMSKCLSL